MRSLVWHRIGYILFVTQLVVAVNVCAQNNPEISQFVQFNTIAGKGDHAPFLLTANRQGVLSLDCTNGYARYGIGICGGLGNSAWRYDAVADVIAGYNPIPYTPPTIYTIRSSAIWPCSESIPMRSSLPTTWPNSTRRAIA